MTNLIRKHRQSIMKYFYLGLIIFLSSCFSDHVNDVGNTDITTGQTAIKNWGILGPYSEKCIHQRIEPDVQESDYKLFEKYYRLSKFHLYPVHSYIQKNDYVDLNQALGIDSAASCFAYCTITSKTDRNVAFLMGFDNNANVWVNKKKCLSVRSKNITKNDYSVKIHLSKGDNLIVIGISSDKDAFGFHLDIADTGVYRKYAYGKNFHSIADHYLVDSGKRLSIKLTNPDFYNPAHMAKVIVTDMANHPFTSMSFNSGHICNIPMRDAPAGIYSCQLTLDRDTFKQKFVYGNYKKIFRKIQAKLSAIPNESTRLNTQTLISRISYLDEFGKRNGYDDVLERKISATLFDLAEVTQILKHKSDSFTQNLGFHIRAFRSRIDNTVNYYAFYTPKFAGANTRLPLVMIMPWVAKQNPFTESWHLAFIDRIEFLKSLADKYGFAIMWQSCRIYEKYNLNPIVSTTAFESFDDLQKSCPIDTDRVYLYGTCSGGLQSLLLANRFPSKIAAVGVEGPEISYLKSVFDPSLYPKQWTVDNSIINTASNFSNIPIYIANSKNDWHGAKEPELSNLITAIRNNGGAVTMDSIENQTRTFFVKMVNDNLITDNIFRFFKNKVKAYPDTIKFSTYQLKYNKAYWISVDDIDQNGLATIKAWCKNNTISIRQENVKALTLHLNEVPALKKGQIHIVVNGAALTTVDYKSQVCINLGKEDIRFKRKSQYTEGPINHFFADKFMVVSGYNPKKSLPLIERFSYNWRYNYFGDCRIKQESQLTTDDIENNNLLIFDDNRHSIVRKLLVNVPVSCFQDHIKISERNIPGRRLSYAFVYPNPKNNKKYILLVGSNYDQINPEIISALSLQGWNDVQVLDNLNRALLSVNFDRNWHLARSR